MATFKAVVTDKKKDGTYNIKIRITHNRETKYIPTIYFVEKDDKVPQHPATKKRAISAEQTQKLLKSNIVGYCNQGSTGLTWQKMFPSLASPL